MLWIILGLILPPLTWYGTRWNFDRKHPFPVERDGEWPSDYSRRVGRHEMAKDNASFGWTIGVSALSLFLAIGLNIYFDSHNRVKEDRYTTLYAMNDGMGVKGRFFLGSGTIESSPVYSYYYKDGEQYRLTYQYANRSYITYTDGTPQLVHHGSHQRYSSWLSIGGTDDWKVDYYGKEDPYEFQVPEGSIQQNYTLDAQ